MNLTLLSTICLSLALSSGLARAQKVVAPVEAYLYSTMPSTSVHRPEMAMDKDMDSYFSSAYGMEDGDDFLVILSRPIQARSIKVITGDAQGNDTLTEGFLEVSTDSIKFSKLSGFDKSGVAGSTKKQQVMALKIRLQPRKGLGRLVIREIQIDSPTPVSHVSIGPARGFVDISQAPDLAKWATQAEKEMESFWTDTAAILYTDGFITPNAVNVIYTTGPDVTGVAATGGGVMTVNSAYCRRFPNDTALTVHETAHVVQATGSNAPGWLIEGVADYIRWVKFEPDQFHPRINVKTATYHDAYKTSATFLGWCALHYDSELVTKLNRVCRYGGYSNALFRKYCGKDIDTLWNEFITAYAADPAHIISKPIPAALAPRPLPAVVRGTSVQIDLASQFDLMGIVPDGAKFSRSLGFDMDGTAFPAEQVPALLVSGNVQYHLASKRDGNLDSLSGDLVPLPNVVVCKGQTITLPSGSHHSLWLLASAINGANKDQTVTVNYTDGSMQTFAQDFSDWYLPENYPGEGRAIKIDHRTLANGRKDPRTFYIYSYGYSLDPSKTVQSVTLPNSEDLRVAAISLAD